MSERKHRCGGLLHPAPVEVRHEVDGLLMIQAVPGLVCDKCHESLLEHHTALELQRGGTPSIWFTSARHVSVTSAVDMKLPVSSSSSVLV